MKSLTVVPKLKPQDCHGGRLTQNTSQTLMNENTGVALLYKVLLYKVFKHLRSIGSSHTMDHHKSSQQADVGF